MGGHGGLNILPQKKWNVYNWDNKEKVEKDEREAEEKAKLKEKRKVEAKLSLQYTILERNKKTKGTELIVEDKRTRPSEFTTKEILLNKDDDFIPKEQDLVERTPTFGEMLKRRMNPWFTNIKRSNHISKKHRAEKNSLIDDKLKKKNELKNFFTQLKEKDDGSYKIKPKKTKENYHSDNSTDNKKKKRKSKKLKKKKKKKEKRQKSENKLTKKKSIEELRKERIEREKKERMKEELIKRT